MVLVEMFADALVEDLSIEWRLLVHPAQARKAPGAVWLPEGGVIGVL